MLAIQGDRVIVYRHGTNGDLVQVYVLTLVQVIGEKREMRLVNREGKDRTPDWSFTQRWYDALHDAPKNEFRAKWTVTIKSRNELSGAHQQSVA